MKTTTHRLAWRAGLCALSLVSASLLTACGGGGASSPAPEVPPAAAPTTPTATTAALVDGTITGFGSVLIDGQRFDDTGATVAINHNPEATTPGTLGDLHTGMHVSAELKDGVLQKLLVDFALVGTVGAVNTATGSLTVFGQTIKTTASTTSGPLPTVFDGFNALSELAVGDLVRVAGMVASDGSITATRIERRVKDGAEIYRLSGAVQAIDTAAKRFSLSGNSSVVVDYSKAKMLPTGAVLENGKLVSVVATSAPIISTTASGGTAVLSASAIEIKARKLRDAKDVSIGGQIADFQSLASLRIGDQQVDASTAVLKGGTVAADIVNGAQALAQGSLSSGVLKASSLKVFKSDTALKALLVGQVTDFVSLSNFNLRGTNVDGSQAVFTKGKAADLATGTWVKVSGQLTATGVLAKEIEIQPPPADKPAHLEGAISGLNLVGKQFTLLGVTVQWTDSTKVSTDGKSLANLANGFYVSVEGNYSGATGVFTVTSVKISGAPSGTKTIGITGVLFDVTTTAFKIGASDVLITSDTKFLPAGTTALALTNGTRVTVKASVTSVNGVITLTALSIEVQKPEKDGDGRDYVYASGLVADFVSSANFKLGGQTIDASGTSVIFVDGDVAKLANGAKVEVQGSVKDGVVKAKRVHFLPG